MNGARLDAKLLVDLEAVLIRVLRGLPGLRKRPYVLSAPGDLSFGEALRLAGLGHRCTFAEVHSGRAMTYAVKMDALVPELLDSMLIRLIRCVRHLQNRPFAIPDREVTQPRPAASANPTTL